MLLEGIGEDPSRPGLVDTPARYARMAEEIFSGLGVDAASVLKPLESPDHNEIVLVKDDFEE